MSNEVIKFFEEFKSFLKNEGLFKIKIVNVRELER